MLSMSSPTSNGIKSEPFSPSASGEQSVPIATLPNMNGTNVPLANGVNPMATPIIPSAPAAAQVQMLPQTQTKSVPQQQPVNNNNNNNNGILDPKQIVKNIPNAPTSSSTPGTIRSGNGGGQLLQFPWKLHEMLHLAEKNGKTDVISWLPGGNGFKVHNKEKFCAEIMPGYFASQKYKTFQRSLNLWGFESVAKGPDRGACYHQYFVKGHPELCHNMTRVKIKGQSNPRTPAAAAAAAAAAAKRAAMNAAMTAAMSNPQAQQQQVAAQQQAQPLNIFAMNPFLPGANMGMPHMGMPGNQANVMAAAGNPYAMAMALQQINPALAAAAMQNPAMNAMLAAQVMAAAANNPQGRAMAVAQQQMAPGQLQVPGPVAMAPGNATFAPGVNPQQQQQQQFQQQQLQQPQLQMQYQPQQQMGPASVAPVPLQTGQVQMSNPGAPAPNGTNNTNANANYAEFLARKNNMEMQQSQLQQANMSGGANGGAKPSAPATDPSNYGSNDGVVDDLVAV